MTLIRNFLLTGLLSTACAWSHEKTDVLVMENGDRLTGEIKSMAGGYLNFSTDFFDHVKVEWEHISSIQSDYVYEVRASDGSRHYGRLSNNVDTGVVLVKTDTGQVPIAVLEVVELRPVSGSFKDKLDLKFSAGLSYTQASDVLQLNLQSDIKYQDEHSLTELSGRTTMSDTGEERSDSNRYTLLREYWTRYPNVVRWFAGTYEDNDSLKLDYRVSAGGGLGRIFMETNGFTLQGIAGVQAVNERSDLLDKQSSVEAVFGARVAAWKLQAPEFSLDTDFFLYPSLTESGRMRAQSDITLNWELVKDFYWDVSAWWSYDNENPEANDTDYGVTTGIGWKY